MEEDVVEEVNESTSEVVENQDVKTYSEEEMEQIKAQLKEDYESKFDAKFNKRWARESSKLEREYAEKDELINLLKEQTGKDNLNELIDLSYSQYGVERPKKNTSKDDEILGQYDAKEILELDDEAIEDEANRLAGISKRSVREQATFMELGKYLTEKRQNEKIKKEIKESGIEEDILDNQDFKDFMGKFNKDTSFADIYELYSKTHDNSKKKPFSAGSAKGKTVKEESEYFTQEEFMALSAEDLKNPKIYEKAMKSKEFF